MTRRALMLAAAVTAFSAVPAAAQFSSDIPGVPRAAVPLHGNKQSRTEWELIGFKLAGPSGDTMSFGTRIGVGRSYRVKSNMEFGFDFTLLQGSVTRFPKNESLPTAPDKYAQGLSLYGLKVGGKLRPYSDLSPEGYGVDVAVAGQFWAPLKPVFGVELKNDSSTTGGYVGSNDENASSSFNTLRGWVQIGAMASYRSQRFLVDAAIMSETVNKRTGADSSEVSPLALYSGVAPRLGAVVRLTPSLAVGGSYWGNGAPPWRDGMIVGSHVEKAAKVGVVLTLGSKPEAGTDIMIMSPTGKFSESVRLYFRFRGTS